jgi:hypothetical protein
VEEEEALNASDNQDLSVHDDPEVCVCVCVRERVAWVVGGTW